MVAVERTLLWLNRNKPLGKGFERTIASAGASLFLASVLLPGVSQSSPNHLLSFAVDTNIP